MARKKITTVGGNLWQIAAKTLGDATQANRIATANNTTDPFIGGSASLFLPAVDLTATGGIPFGPITETGQPFDQQAYVLPPGAPVPTPTPTPVPTPTPPAPVDNPPPSVRARGATTQMLHAKAWEQPDPAPTLTVKLPPVLTAVQVNTPPPSIRARGATTQNIVAKSWEPPDPLPTLNVKVPVTVASVPVNNPPPSIRARGATTQLMLAKAWEPPDPLPTLNVKAAPPVLAVTVNIPIPNDGPWLPNILAAWQPPDPLPTPQRKLSPQLTIPRVDAPAPNGLSDWMVGILNAWQPPPHQPPRPVKFAPLSIITESADKTDITTVGPTISDANGVIWDLVSSGAGLQVRMNSVPVTVASVAAPPFVHRLQPYSVPARLWEHADQWILLPTSVGPAPAAQSISAVEIYYLSHVVYYQDAGGNWFDWNGTTWVATSNPKILVPGQPTGLTSTAVSNNAVNLSWTAPSTGSVATSFHVQYSIASSGNWLDGPTVSTTNAQVTGLGSSTSYDFRVSATNGQGTGSYSTTYTVSTVATVTAVTWQPTNKSAQITLSSDKLTATAGGSATAFSTPQSCVTTTSIATGRAWFQVTFSTKSNNACVGLVNSSFVMGTASGLGSTTNGVGFFPFTGAGSAPAQNAYYNGAAILPQPPTQTLNSTTGTITDAVGAVWALVNTADGLGINRNGILTDSAEVTLLLYWNHLIYQQNQNNDWWYWSISLGEWTFAPNGDPRNVGQDVAGDTATYLVDADLRLFWVQTPAMVAEFGINTWNDNPLADPFNNVGGLPVSVAGNLLICFFTSESGATALLNAGSSAVVGSVNIPANFPAWSGQIINVTMPGAVTLTAGTAGPTSEPLSWTVASGTPTITYTVQRSPHNGNTFVTVGTTTTTTFTDTGLTPNGVSYDYQVFGSNGAGNGPVSNTVVATTSSQTVPPDQVGTLTFGSITPTSIVVNLPLNLTGAVPTGYQLQYRVAGPGTFTNGPLYNESADGTDRTSATQSVIDANNAVFALATSVASGLQITRNGTLTTSSNVAELLYWNHAVYHRNTSSTWFTWNGTAWVSTLGPQQVVITDPRIATGGSISPSGSALTSNAGSIRDSTNRVWSLTTGGGQVVINGVTDTNTANAIVLLYWNQQIYHENTGLSWYVNSGAGAGAWTQVAGDPRFVGLTVSGLATNQSYNFQAFASNSAGNGPTSAVVSAATTAHTISVTPISSTTPNTSFIVQGTLGSYGNVTPSLGYADDGSGTLIPLP